MSDIATPARVGPAERSAARRRPGPSIHGVALALGVSVAGCSGSTFFVSPEGNPTFGPRNAATGPAGAGVRFGDRSETPRPTRHVARSAYDRWRPPPLGVLPPGGVLRNTSTPVTVAAGEMSLVLRASDQLVPAWGGDIYLRVDLRAGELAERPPPRDLVVVLDTRDRGALARARRVARGLFETLRAGDRGALVATTQGGRAIVPLLPHAAAPLLIERTVDFVPDGGDSLPGAMALAAQAVESRDPGRLRRVVVLSGSGAVIEGEAREWIETAISAGADVSLVPLTRGAAARFERLGLVTQAIALPELEATGEAEREAVDELSARPPSRTVARGVVLALESIPGPSHLIEVAGAAPVWTPSGGEVSLGDVRAGDARTLVLRAHVPPWHPGGDYELAVRVRYTDERGPHEARRVLTARYSGSPEEHAGSRAGDVIQYVSLLNTLSSVQAALVRSDDVTLATLRDPATLQARALDRYGREHRDPVMADQAALLLELLGTRAAPP